MAPKVKVTREEIVSAALDLVRREEALNARSLAKELNCSTQPVFSNFASVEEVREAVLQAAYRLYLKTMREEAAKPDLPPYKAAGMGYIRFAREEKQLFRLLFMRSRTAVQQVREDEEELRNWAALIREKSGLSEEDAARMHLEMWACVHGIAAMLATDYQDLDGELVSGMLTDLYQGLRKRYEEKTSWMR